MNYIRCQFYISFSSDVSRYEELGSLSGIATGYGMGGQGREK
jgi:hypothetical protein